MTGPDRVHRRIVARPHAAIIHRGGGAAGNLGKGEGVADRQSEDEGRETILLVDDDAAVRRVAARVLRRAGYTVLEAESGPQALATSRAAEGPIDLLLTDVVMPEMNGRELSQALAPERPETKVLFMSGYTEDDVILRGVSVAEVNFVAKPFTLDGLQGVVRRVLDGTEGPGGPR